MNEIILKSHQIIKDKLDLNGPEIKDEAKFYDDLGVDSLDLIEVIVDVERAFNIRIDDQYYNKLTTVGSLIRCVSQNLRPAV